MTCCVAFQPRPVLYRAPARRSCVFGQCAAECMTRPRDGGGHALNHYLTQNFWRHMSLNTTKKHLVELLGDHGDKVIVLPGKWGTRNLHAGALR